MTPFPRSNSNKKINLSPFPVVVRIPGQLRSNRLDIVLQIAAAYPAQRNHAIFSPLTLNDPQETVIIINIIQGQIVEFFLPDTCCIQNLHNGLVPVSESAALVRGVNNASGLGSGEDAAGQGPGGFAIGDIAGRIREKNTRGAGAPGT